MLLGELVGAAGTSAGTGATGGVEASAGETGAGVPSGGAGGEGSEEGEAGAPGACSYADGGATTGLTESGVYNDGPLPAPWETSFEEGFCDYRFDAGFCYANGAASYRVVTSPVRTGSFAAAFEVVVEGTPGTNHTRCVREGLLPTEAYYGAWYFLPEPASDPNNWNLFFFQGGEIGFRLHGLWDVSLEQRANGDLAAYVRNQLAARVYRQQAPVPIPIGRWFQLEFYLKRAADASGEVALFQDGVEVLRVANIRTDDSSFGQWYVGNLAHGLRPSQFTLYVDDVTVRLGP